MWKCNLFLSMYISTALLISSRDAYQLLPNLFQFAAVLTAVGWFILPHS
jgi:hypothetical protein